MNYIKLQLEAFEIMDTDRRLTPYHVSLYLSLFRAWNLNFFKNPISINRDEMMQLSKIGSANTYTKTIKELHEFGYIRYEPSFNRHKGSLVYLYRFDKGSVIDVRPSINNTNKINGEYIKQESLNMIKERDKKVVKKNSGEQEFPPPEMHIQIYFEQKGQPKEAEKFYNYYQSIGWLVGGKTQMKDWKAAARNWLINAPKFARQPKATAPKKKYNNKPKPGNLHTNLHKDYSEPL